MLARTYKTAAELGLLENEHQALWTVVHNWEDRKIPRENFWMGSWCGTMKCIAGWANFYDKTAFPEVPDISGHDNIGPGPNPAFVQMSRRLPRPLMQIFSGDYNATADGHIARLRVWLETGELLTKSW